MEIKERIIKFIEVKGISKRGFAASINKSNSYVNNIISTVSVDVIADIKNIYPDLNINWLLTGEGEMLNDTQPAKSETTPSADLVAYLEKTIKDQTKEIGDLKEEIGRLKILLEQNNIDHSSKVG